MPTEKSERVIGVLAVIVIALAGVGAFFETQLGGPGSTAFVVRLLLVSIAAIGVLLLVLTLRNRSVDSQGAYSAPRQ